MEPSIYNTIYHNIENIRGYNRYFHYSNQVLKEKDPLEYLANSEDIYWSIKKFLESKNDKNLKILEVGCGFGYLTYAISKKGYNIKGMDISQVAIEEATKRYGDLFFCADLIEYAKEADPSYDVIIFTELIEHIQDIKSFLKAASNLLKPGGCLVMTTPNKTPYPNDVLWETEPPPIHLWWFSEDSIKLMGKMFNYRVSFIDFTAYNRQELKKHNQYTKPYTQIRNFQRSREPRLGPYNEILNLPSHIICEPPRAETKETPFEISEGRKKLKKYLATFGLLKTLQRAKALKMRAEKYYQDLKPIVKLYLDPHRKRRITLCAILQKIK